MRETAVVCALAAALSAGSAPAAPPPVPSPRADSAAHLAQARRHCEFGQRAMKVGNFARARRHYEAAVALSPAYPEAHLGLGHIAMSERRFEDALREYTAARDGFAEWERALADARVDRFRDSREEVQILRDNLTALKGVYGSQIPATTAQTMILDIENRIRRLESQADPTPAAGPSAPAETHFYIGNALWRLDRPGEALEQWRLCAEGNPRFALVHNNLAVAYWHRGETNLALASLEKAEALGLSVPDDFKAQLVSALPTPR